MKNQRLELLLPIILLDVNYSKLFLQEFFLAIILPNISTKNIEFKIENGINNIIKWYDLKTGKIDKAKKNTISFLTYVLS